MKQIIMPNPNVPYYGGLCEGFIEGTVGQATAPFKDGDGDYTTVGVYPTATAAWEANNGNHPGELPPEGMRVAVYFSLGSTDAGHTALALEDGRVASSTQSGYHPTAYIHPNLQDLIDIYTRYNGSCTYLGWTEYIGNLQVIEGEDMPISQKQLDKLIKMAKQSEPNEVELNDDNWMKDPGLAIDTLWKFYGEGKYKEAQCPGEYIKISDVYIKK